MQDGYAHLRLALGEGTKRAGVLEFGVPRESDVPPRPIASFPPRIRVRGRLRRESRVLEESEGRKESAPLDPRFRGDDDCVRG